jgi:hypothetical protein
LAISDALRPLGLKWYVFGAQAVIAAGAVRVTADIDITTEDTSSSRLLSAFERAGYSLRDDVEDIEALIEHHRILPLVHWKTGMQLDVVRAGPGPEEGMLERVQLRRVGKRQIPFVSTNDLLVLKILAGRGKDLEDVRALLVAAQKEIDVELVRTRLDELGSLIDDSTLRRTFDEQVAVSKNRPTRRRNPSSPRKRRST